MKIENLPSAALSSIRGGGLFKLIFDLVPSLRSRRVDRNA